jgi:hypothetical protein
MNWTGGADRPGPAPNTHEGNRKARSGAASPARASRSAAFGLRPGTGAAGFIGKRRAVPSIQAAGFPANRVRQPWLHPVRLPRHDAGVPCAPLPRSGIPPGYVRTNQDEITRETPISHRPADTATDARACTKSVSGPGISGCHRLRMGASAPGLREALRYQVVAGIDAIDRDGGKRPPIRIGPEPFDHHLPARQQPAQRDA